MKQNEISNKQQTQKEQRHWLGGDLVDLLRKPVEVGGDQTLNQKITK
jgi:hypothetical protein